MSNLQAMADLLERLSEIQKSSRLRVLGDMELFLNEYKSSKTLFYEDRINKFNLFQILGIRNREITHSHMLAWLLHCNSEHGQKNSFLNALIKTAKLDFEIDDQWEYTVKTELLEEDAFIDIAIYAPRRFVIFIENKIYADEQPNQLAREFKDMRAFGNRYAIPKDRQFAIFLTPTGWRGQTGKDTHWYTLAYQELVKEFHIIAMDMPHGKSRLLIEDWIDNAKEWSCYYD